MDLQHKNVILTGVSSGLGKAIAVALIKKGATVYGVARNRAKLTTIQSELGEKFHPVNIDITNKTTLKKWVKTMFNNNTFADVLINNAGIGSFQKIDELPEEDWEEMINTNLNGMFYITHAFVPFLKENKNTTHIINIGSILGTMGRSEGAAYCTSKYGVSGFSDALFKELRFFNIKVTCVNPGSIETDFFASSGIEKHGQMLQPSDLADTIVHLLETPDNMLINELTVRPLNPKITNK